MSTIFIAVQCYQCSTMQVKQQKKSSNKWTCVVCNQKQSVRKAFCQGFMARDVRKFVQSFNMSRQFAEEQHTDETLVPLPENTNNQPPSNHTKRTDWSEYIDPEDNRDNRFNDEQDDVFDSKIVMELPKALFKKPKLNTYRSGFGTEDGEKGYGPVFSKKISTKTMVFQDKKPRKYQPTTVNRAFKRSDYTAQEEEHISADKEPRQRLPAMNEGASKWRTYATQENKNDFTESRKCHSTTTKGTSKWRDYIIHDENEDLADKVPQRCQPRTTKGASKWDNYITEDDDDLLLKRGREFADHTGQWSGVFEATLYEERVEEDIHPDFQ